MTSNAIEKSNCIFCNIVNKLESTEILYEDEDVCVFRDIKPASDFHILTIPKRHIEDAKALTTADKNLVDRMLCIAKEQLAKNNLSVDDARFGYHWPPFRSVRHLHLHTIAPESKMGLISRIIFKKDSYWFVSVRIVYTLAVTDSVREKLKKGVISL
ncbi:adenosine 5'-monophosphoramidase HINT3 [Papilio machaon]|uniref:adenosine 5'-monophosphoramidase HINT3 n=1 Tax=Papilio machaon TaxID=76193 RepID=UPI001E6641BC|nr:adenosine 5'-monophosphoramidase HINT3 [Papilio machaon]